MKGIEVKNISRSFKDTKALSGVNLIFEEGKIYGLLGRNGAGKSTLLNIISNRKYPDEGSVIIDGIPSVENDEALSKIFLINETNLYPEGMKVKDAFNVSKEFYPSFDEDYALKLSEMFELNIKKKIKSLSTGYQSIFRNILALSVNVPYVFFDEPVLGLDAYHRDLFYRLLIEKYSEEPFTAVISTHLIEEVANVIEEVIIIKKGEILIDQSRDSLLANSFTVSGTISAVDEYLSSITDTASSNSISSNDMEVLGSDVIGGLKSAYILGSSPAAVPAGLEKTPMDLQKLFICLTSM